MLVSAEKTKNKNETWMLLCITSPLSSLLQNVRGALSIFSVPKKVVHE